MMRAYAWLVAVAVLFVDLTGGVVMNRESAPGGWDVFSSTGHRDVSYGVALLLMGLGLWFLLAEKRAEWKPLGWTVLAGDRKSVV